MEKFTKLSDIAAPLPMINIDTDMIIPKQFLKTIKRTGLGANLFDELRFNEDGSEIKNFVLNNDPYKNAKIIVAGDNFGCGSSREHAPWALLDYGIRCVIAPSFADIFYNNCFKNGILPVKLSKEGVDELIDYTQNADNPVLSIDLEKNEISIPETNRFFKFDLDEFRKKCLLEGLDDIALTLKKEEQIDNFAQDYKGQHSWI